MPKKFKIAKDFLIKEYLKKGKSCGIIANQLGCSNELIRKNLIKFDIPRHNLSYRSKEGLINFKKRNEERYSIKDEDGICKNASFYGKHHTLQNKKSLGIKNKNNKLAHEKISETRKKLFAEGKIIHPFLNKHITEKHKKKISKSRTIQLDIGAIKEEYTENDILPYPKG